MADAPAPSRGDAAGALFAEDSRTTVGAHVYVRVRPVEDPDFLNRLSKRIQLAYFDQSEASKRIRQAANELRMFSGAAFDFSDDQIAEALEDELDAVIPQEWREGGKRLKALDVQRSELAEIIGHEVLNSLFGTAIPASRIADKEIPDQPTRGADLVGIENLNALPVPLLVVGEVKGSCDTSSPPGVVDGMKQKLSQLATDRRTLLQELIWLRDHCDDEYAEICARLCAYFQLRAGPLELVLCPILLRTVRTHKESDPGKFLTDPDSFNYSIRFVSVIIDEEDLFDFAVKVYRLARELDHDER